LHVFFGEPEHGVRAVARRLGVSRWKAERTIIQATARIVLELQLDVGLDARDLFLVARDTEADASLSCATRAAGRERSEARIAADLVRGHLARLLSIRYQSRRERTLTNDTTSAQGSMTRGECEGLQRFLQGEPHELEWQEAS